MMDLSGVGRILSNGFDREDLTGIHSMGAGRSGAFARYTADSFARGASMCKTGILLPFLARCAG